MFAMSAIAVSAAQSATDVTTSDRFSELVTFFLIALAIVAPSTLIVFRRMNRKGAGLRGEETTADPADTATVEAAEARLQAMASEDFGVALDRIGTMSR